MLPEVLTALASAGGAAVVQAAGTDAWKGFRVRIARLIARGDAKREHAELERLEETASVLSTVQPTEAERTRIRQEAAWQARFEGLLESLDGDEQAQVASELRHLLDSYAPKTGAAAAKSGGFAVGGNADIHAEGGSVAAGVIHGGVHVGNPFPLDLSQG